MVTVNATAGYDYFPRLTDRTVPHSWLVTATMSVSDAPSFDPSSRFNPTMHVTYDGCVSVYVAETPMTPEQFRGLRRRFGSMDAQLRKFDPPPKPKAKKRRK